MPRSLRVNDIARAVGLHPNSIRIYETWGYLPPIPRAANGYRQYTPMHLEQVRLIRLALEWPYLDNRPTLIELVKYAATGDLGMAMELAYEHLAFVRVERTFAESAIEFLERWAAGHLLDTPRQRVTIGEAARHLNVSTDKLRNWERNGLLNVPRDPANEYRLYGTAEFGRLRVIRALAQAGYSQMAILRMLLQFDAGKTENLRAALEVPAEEDEGIYSSADRWLSTLVAHEERAQKMIRHIAHMIEMTHAAGQNPPT